MHSAVNYYINYFNCNINKIKEMNIMMSSNQIFEISGSFSQLHLALDFAINYLGENEKGLCFQITDDGKFCIGWGHKEGWEKFQFCHLEIISKIIVKHLESQKYKRSSYEGFDGKTNKGFLMKVIPEMFSDEYDGIKNPFYGIISFQTFINYYSK